MSNMVSTTILPLISLICVINLHLVEGNLMGMSAGGSSPVYRELVTLASKDRFHGTHLSYVNEYMCQRMSKADLLSVDKCSSELARVASALKQVQNAEKFRNKVKTKVDIMIELFRVYKSGPSNLCEIVGQDAMQMADLEVKFLLDDQDLLPENRKGCLPIKMIVDHYNEQRRSLCPNYFNELLLGKINRMEANHLRHVTGSLDSFMDLVMEPLGGYSTSTCSLPIESLHFTNGQAGRALLDGLRMVASQEDFDWMKSGHTGDEVAFLTRFAQVRNKYIVKPCEYFVDQLKDRIKTIKLYKSMYSSYEKRPDSGDELEFNSSKSDTNTKRFHRAWALFNTCQLALQKLPTISLSLLDGLHFDLSSSKLDNKQIYELIR